MAAAGHYAFRHAVGPVEQPVGGDITLLPAIAGHLPDAVERRLGFHRGRLSEGYCVLILLDPVTISDFSWGDRTRYSGGTQAVEVVFDSNPKTKLSFAVPRLDIVRGNSLVQNANDDIADKAVNELLRQSSHRINAGVANKSVIKVIPNIPHNDDMPHHLQYPDADAGNVPQWKLTNGKRMACVAQVSPGGTYTG